MTEHEDLIAEARRIAALSPNSDAGICFTSLVAALEKMTAERDEAWRVAAEQSRMERERAENAEAERDELKVDLETKSVVHECCEKAQERDALAAVVEQMKQSGHFLAAEEDRAKHSDLGCACEFCRILQDAPSVALDRVKAEERERIAFRLIGPEENLAASVRAFKAGWHQADLSGKTGQRVADGLRNVVADRIEKGESNE